MPLPAEKSPPPIALSYEPAPSPVTGRGPRWVIVIAVVYGVFLVALGSFPVWEPAVSGDSAFWPGVILGTLLVTAELALLLTPIRIGQRRPVSRRALAIPIVATGMMLAVLALGAGLAIHEWVRAPDLPGWLVLAMVLILWGAWAFLFWMLSGRRDPASFGAGLHRWLYAGSVLELLIAVPAHVVCRRRSECCAGIESGIGLCLGIVVMLVAFGPSIAVLYYRRWKQITRS
ncbi:MAG: hypothetical protein ACHRHE_03435 [Tepidisphaerales bacterium]